jgi:hypothetical protein
MKGRHVAEGGWRSDAPSRGLDRYRCHWFAAGGGIEVRERDTRANGTPALG